MFYRFHQNNSGGRHVEDEYLCSNVYIEADSPEKANSILKSFGGYFDGVDSGFDCDCCGDRWYPAEKWDESTLEDILDNEPQSVKLYGGWTTPDTRVFCADGTLIEFTRVKEKDKPVEANIEYKTWEKV